MKLYYSATSPYVRKCLVSAYELGLRERMELLPAAAHPVNRDRALVVCNPLGKVPTLVTDDGTVLYDSRVICEYLNALGDERLIPKQPAARWATYRDEALGDGILDAAVLVRYETFVRPESFRWKDWIDGQMDKVTCSLAEIEPRAGSLDGRIDLGTIAIGCALGYLDFRYASLRWKKSYPKTAAWFERFAARESMLTTRPPAG
ncbi:MAG TPA: glutathione S-transferase N-terminal domain-containing protein [Steroidobacteraceae bacterium]